MAARAGAARVVRPRRAARRPTSSSPSASAASGRRSAIPPARTTARRSKLFALLGARAIGIELTESYAMIPAAAVSGLYLAHPECALLLGRPDRPRPAPGLRGSKGAPRGTSGEVVAAKSLLAAALLASRSAPPRRSPTRRPSGSRAPTRRRPSACSCTARTSARAGRAAQVEGGAADARRTAPASTRRSPTSSSPATPTRATPSRRPGSSSTRTSRC